MKKQHGSKRVNGGTPTARRKPVTEAEIAEIEQLVLPQDIKGAVKARLAGRAIYGKDPERAAELLGKFKENDWLVHPGGQPQTGILQMLCSIEPGVLAEIEAVANGEPVAKAPTVATGEETQNAKS